jgi:hypothetical protein
MSKGKASDVEDLCPSPTSPASRDVATTHDPALSDVDSSHDRISASLNDHICLVCQEMLSASFETKMCGSDTFNYCRGDHHSSLTAARTTAAQGCFICSQFIAVVTRASTTMFEEDSPMAFQAACSGPHEDSVTITLQPLEGVHRNIGGVLYPMPSLNLHCSIPLRKNAFELDLMSLSRGCHKSNNERTLALAEEWLKICACTHGKCSEQQRSEFVPPRLLDLSRSSIRLVETTETMHNYSYVALSHCWGLDSTTLKLTSSNRQSMMEEISLAALPKTFKDAVSISRELGINWLWIDSLCILQSNPLDENDQQHKDDWLMHVSLMDQIYQNCMLNIVAAHGTNPSSGCFPSREDLGPPLSCVTDVHSWKWLTNTPPGGAWRQEERLQMWQINSSSHVEEVRRFGDCHIHSRGWVAQERLLSPRSLHFDKEQVLWECSEVVLASETFPLGVDVDPTSNEKSPYAWDTSGLEEQRDRWLSILEDYTKRSLTMSEDKLPAIAGVARKVAAVLDDVYVAGHFKSSILLSLLWRRGLGNRANVYRAPSWSWASWEGGVWWPKQIYVFWKTLSVVKKHCTKLTDANNPFGQVKSGYLTLHGPVATLSTSSIKTDHSEFTAKDEAVEGLQSSEVHFFFDTQPVVFHWDVVTLLVITVYDDGLWIQERGLILTEAVPEKPTTSLPASRAQFVRVGFFSTSGDKGAKPNYKGYSYSDVTII